MLEVAQAVTKLVVLLPLVEMVAVVLEEVKVEALIPLMEQMELEAVVVEAMLLLLELVRLMEEMVL